MKVLVRYNKIDYERAIDFMAARKQKLHNASFKKMLEAELSSLIDDVKNVVKPDVNFCSNSSMGFFVHVEDIHKESLDSEDYIIDIKILIDLSDDYIIASKEYEVDLEQ